jgi:hypothetical protein
MYCSIRQTNAWARNKTIGTVEKKWINPHFNYLTLPSDIVCCSGMWHSVNSEFTVPMFAPSNNKAGYCMRWLDKNLEKSGNEAGSSRTLNRISSKCKYRGLPLWEHVWRHFGDAGFEALLGTSYFHTPSFPHSLPSLLGIFYEVRETTASFCLWPSISDLILRKIFAKFGVGILYKTLSTRPEFRENRHSDSLSWRAAWILTRSFLIYGPILVHFDTGYIYVISLGIYTWLYCAISFGYILCCHCFNLYCGCFNLFVMCRCVCVCVCVWVRMCGFCNVWVCVCVSFVMYECVYVWVL